MSPVIDVSPYIVDIDEIFIEQSRSLAGIVWSMLNPAQSPGYPARFFYDGVTDHGEQETNHLTAYAINNPYVRNIRSVFEDYDRNLWDVLAPARELSGIRDKAMATAYGLLDQGYIVDAPYTEKEQPGDFPEANACRARLEQVRSGVWKGDDANAAQTWEGRWLTYEGGVENTIYVIAASLIRYRGIIQAAQVELRDQMDKFLDKIHEKFGPGQTPNVGSIDWESVLMSAFVTVAIAGITGGTGIAAAGFRAGLGALTTQVLKSGGKQSRKISDGGSWPSLFDSYLKDTEKLIKETAEALGQLEEDTKKKLSKTKHEHIPETGKKEGFQPYAPPKVKI